MNKKQLLIQNWELFNHSYLKKVNKLFSGGINIFDKQRKYGKILVILIVSSLIITAVVLQKDRLVSKQENFLVPTPSAPLPTSMISEEPDRLSILNQQIKEDEKNIESLSIDQGLPQFPILDWAIKVESNP